MADTTTTTTTNNVSLATQKPPPQNLTALKKDVADFEEAFGDVRMGVISTDEQIAFYGNLQVYLESLMAKDTRKTRKAIIQASLWPRIRLVFDLLAPVADAIKTVLVAIEHNNQDPVAYSYILQQLIRLSMACCDLLNSFEQFTSEGQSCCICVRHPSRGLHTVARQILAGERIEDATDGQVYEVTAPPAEEFDKYSEL